MFTLVSVNHPGPLVVHCCDGVTRTGLFLAAYKLWLDAQDSSCRSLAILPTVVSLRRYITIKHRKY